MRETPILELLGPPQLRTPDGVSVELRQKAFALAALLQIEFRGRARRQAVADRLWETASGSQASTNLRQVLLHTRALEGTHGFELFESDQTWISLSPSVSSDLTEITRMRIVNESAELDRLMALYRGGLLEGLTGSADELSRWIETERTRIEDQFVAHAVAAALRVGGRSADAALARLVEIQPFTDEVCQAQMQHYRKSGDEIAVRAAYNSFRTRLWKSLQVMPAPETEALLVPPPATPASARSPDVRDARGLGLIERARVPRIVLLPPLQEFGRSVTPKHIAPALIEDVTISLCRLRSLTVIAPHTAWQFDPFSALDEIRSHQIDYAVESRVALDHSSVDGTLGLAVRLIRASGREIVWTDKFKFTVAAAPERYRDLVNGIAGSLADRVEAAELAAERTHRDPTAYSHYLSGREDMRSFDLPRVRKARKSFRVSAELAPELAMAESSLARSYVVEWVLRAGADNALLDKARLHAERAVSLDPLDGNAYRELGRAALFVGDLDDSLRQFEHAERYSPNHADILADYADTLTHNSDFAGARQRIQAALQLNPMPPDEYWWTLGGLDYLEGRWNDAIATLSKMKNQEPALRLLAMSAAMAGDMDAARQYRVRSTAYQPDFTIAGWVRRIPMRNPADVDLYIEGLRRAGFK